MCRFFVCIPYVALCGPVQAMWWVMCTRICSSVNCTHRTPSHIVCQRRRRRHSVWWKMYRFREGVIDAPDDGLVCTCCQRKRNHKFRLNDFRRLYRHRAVVDVYYYYILLVGCARLLPEAPQGAQYAIWIDAPSKIRYGLALKCRCNILYVNGCADERSAR